MYHDTIETRGTNNAELLRRQKLKTTLYLLLQRVKVIALISQLFS